MKRRTKIIIFILALIVLGGIAMVASTLRYGFSAHDQPTMPERVIAHELRDWASPSDLRGAKNPVPLTSEMLAEARAHFADHCAICHGNDGKGQTEMGRHMYPKAPDMTAKETQSLSDGQLFSIIENGIRLTGMPGWGNGTAESARGSWTLVHFIRHVPKITSQELEEMKTMNPISPMEMQEQKQEQKEEEEFLSGTHAH
ncbi:MAG TPA: c-type cytochrome [Thermoanaerobaculia bacterium]